MIERGSSRERRTSKCPTNLKEAKPKAGTIRDVAKAWPRGNKERTQRPRKRTAEGNEAQKSIEADILEPQVVSPFLTHLLLTRASAGGSVRRKSIGLRMCKCDDNGHVGPAGAEMHARPPVGGSKPAKGREEDLEPHERCRAE